MTKLRLFQRFGEWFFLKDKIEEAEICYKIAFESLHEFGFGAINDPHLTRKETQWDEMTFRPLSDDVRKYISGNKAENSVISRLINGYEKRRQLILNKMAYLTQEKSNSLILSFEYAKLAHYCRYESRSEAESAFQTSLSLLKSVNSHFKPIFTTSIDFAQFYHEGNCFASAETVLRRVILDQNQNYRESPRMAKVFSLLRDCLAKQQRTFEAENTAKTAITIYNSFECDSDAAIDEEIQLATIYMNSGKTALAEATFRRCLGRMKGSQDRNRVFCAKAGLIAAYFKANNIEKEEVILLHTAALYSNFIGKVRLAYFR